MANMSNIEAFQYVKINTYLPVVLVLHCGMVASGVWDRVFSLCVPQNLRFSRDDIDDDYTEKVRGGRREGRWLGREKRLRQALDLPHH